MSWHHLIVAIILADSINGFDDDQLPMSYWKELLLGGEWNRIAPLYRCPLSEVVAHMFGND